MSIKPNKTNTPKPPKTLSSSEITLIISQYSALLTALQGLYTDCHNTADRLLQLESELHEIKTLLIQLLKAQQSLVDFEQKLFRKNLST